MKALVTGASGFIGSHLADHLHEIGFDVRCTYRENSNLRWQKDKPYELYKIDFNDEKTIENAVVGVDYIFHVAGVIAASNINEYLLGNQNNTEILLKSVYLNNPNIKRFVYISSFTAVGPAESLSNPVNEETPYNPITSYGISKKEAELKVLNFKSKLSVTIVRPSAVFGARDRAIFPLFKSVKYGIKPIIGSNTKYLSLINPYDLVRGIADLAQSDLSIGEIYFISSEKYYTYEYLIELVKSAIGRKCTLNIRLQDKFILRVGGISEMVGKTFGFTPVFNYEKGVDFIQDYWICSIEKAKEHIGYKQEISMEDGIQDAVDWYKKFGWL